MSTPTFINLTGANPSASVLANLQSAPAAAQAAINGKLDSNLKAQLAAMLAGTPVLAGLVANMPAIDIAGANSLTPRTFLKQQLDPMVAKDPVMQQAVDEEIARVSIATTVGTMLGLNQPLQTHPLFQDDMKKAQLSVLLSTSPQLASSALQIDFIEAYTSMKGTIGQFWSQLSRETEYKALVPELQFTLQLANLTLNNTPLVQAIQHMRQQGKLNSYQDLAKLSANDWSNLLNPPNAPFIPIPAGVAGNSTTEKTAAYVGMIQSTLTRAFPTTVFAQSIAAQPAIDTGLIQAILTANPGLSPSRPLPSNAKLDTLSAADQVTARASWEALRKEINTYPGFSYQTVLGAGSSATGTQLPFSNPIRAGVTTFINNSPDFDFQTGNIKSYITSHPGALNGVPTAYQSAVITQLYAYQRVYRVYSDTDTINNLMGEGFDSAKGISGMASGVFVKLYSGMLGGTVQAETIYGKAQFITGQITNIYLRFKEALNRVNPLVNGNYTFPAQSLLQQFPDWAALFGPTGYCECDECMAIDGPTAYFVDLLQYLGTLMPNVLTNTNSYGYTPLDVLVGYENNPNNYDFTQSPAVLNAASDSNPPSGRRPDLSYLKLNCGNTETIMPYIDLINEILESYIFYVQMGIVLSGVSQPSLSSFTLPGPVAGGTVPNIPKAGNIVSIDSQTVTPAVGYTLAADNKTLQLESAQGAIIAGTFPIVVSGWLSASNNTPTDATSDELSVNPEYSISQVYDPTMGPLATAVYPFSLPFNRPLEVARVYLKNLNSSLHDVMKTFQINGSPTEMARAAEYLGLSPAELSILNGAHQSNLAQYYGFPAGTSEATLMLTTNPYLGVVQNFMSATGLAFSDLVNLLETQFINPNQTVTIFTPTQANSSGNLPISTCNLTTTTFVNLYGYTIEVVRSTPAPLAPGLIKPPPPPPELREQASLGFLWRALIFLRLWKKTGWAMTDLDKALQALGYTGVFPPTLPFLINSEIITITDDMLEELAGIKWLLETLQITVTQALSLWSDIDTDGRDSLYIGLFQNTAVINPVDLNFRLTYSAPLAPSTLTGALLTAWSDGTTQGLPTYNTSLKVLQFTGTMTDAQEDDLLAWAGTNAAALLAVQNLFNQRWYQGTGVADLSAPISANINTILAALQIGDDDLAAIAVDAGLADLTNAVITVTASSTNPTLAWSWTITPFNPSLAATETIVIGGVAPVTTLTIGGTLSPGDNITVSVTSGGTGSFGVVSLTHLVVAADTPTSIATDLNAQINANSAIHAAGIQGTVSLVSWFPQATLTLANLSTLYRYAMLAGALNLSVEDLIGLKKISGIDPFPAATAPLFIHPIIQFVKAAQMVAASKFSIPQLNYLYRAIPDLNDSLPPTEVSEQQLLIGLSAGLQKIAAADAFAPDPTGKALRKNLGVLLPSDQVDPTIDLINGSAVYSSPLTALPADMTSPGNPKPFLTTLVNIGGTLTFGDSLTLTLTSNNVQGTQAIVTHPVIAGDTLSGIAADLNTRIAANSAMTQAGITATVKGTVITILTPLGLNPFQAWNVLTAPANPANSATETLTINGAAPNCEISVNGAATTGDILTLILASNGGTGTGVSLAYTVLATDSTGSIAENIATLINNNAVLIAAGYTASAKDNSIAIATTLDPGPFQAWSATVSPSNATESVSVLDAAPGQVALITSATPGGSATPGDTVTLGLALNGSATAAVSLPYAVVAGDTPGAIAAALGNEINNNSALNAAGITASVSGGAILISSPLFQIQPVVVTTHTIPTPAQATESVTFGGSATSPTITIGGTTTTPGDELTLGMTLTGITGFSVNLTYPVATGDSTASIANNLAALINGNTSLAAVGITATAPTGSSVITLTSPSSLVLNASMTAAPPVATETLTIGTGNTANTVTVGGNAITPGDVLGLSISLNGVTGSSVSLSYEVVQGDSTGSIASALAGLINASTILVALGISANVAAGSSVITITAPPSLSLAVSTTPAPAVATETLLVGGIPPANTITVGGGTITPGDILSVSFGLNSGSGSTVKITYQVVTGDTTASIAGSLNTLINSNPALNLAGIMASVPSGSGVIAVAAAPALGPAQTWNLTAAAAVTGGTATETGTVTVSALACTGPISDATSSNLLNLSSAGDVAFQQAVSDLYAQAQNILCSNLYFLAPASAYSSSLANLPIGLSLPAIPPGQVIYETGNLICTGPLSYANLLLLKGLSNNAAYNAALNDLYQQAWGNAIQQLIDEPPSSSPADRYNYVLGSLLSYLQSTQSKSLVKQTLSQALSLGTATVDLLLEGDPTTGTSALLVSQTLAGQPSMIDFLGGLLAFYYADNAFGTTPTARIDYGVDLDGTEGAFGGAKWFGQLVPPSTDTYTFAVSLPATIGQVQLFVNGQDAVKTPQVSLQAGEIYPIQLVLTANTATPIQPQFQLQWSNSSIPLQAIPANVFVLGADSSSAPYVSPPNAFVQGGVYYTLSRLNRIALLVNGFSMLATELEYLSAHSTDFEGTDPNNGATQVPFSVNSLPLDNSPVAQATIDGDAPAFFNQWQRLYRLYRLKAGLPKGGNLGLFDIFQAAADSNSSTALTITNTVLQATGWSAKEFNILTGIQTASAPYTTQIGFALADVNFINEIDLVQLADCLALVNKTGVSSQQFFVWALNPPDGSIAQNIQNSTKARYSDSAWLQVGESLNDKIRTRSRDALVNYILANAGNWGMQVDGEPITIKDQLYEFFLIDVQMGSCMDTSRLVQATAAVQLFVQRCLMNLENNNPGDPEVNVSPTQLDATEWEWMQNYRLWQANREVFLYPENWIDPTIRDDRTPFFQDLQNNLLQGPITNDNAEQAYYNYLKALDEVAQLQIMGTYTVSNNNPTSPVSTTHVFGRTYATPHVYYYCNVTQTGDSIGNAWTNSWTAWERIDTDIQSDQLIPIVWNNRLYIFWPLFTETANQTANQPQASSQNPPPPATYNLQVQIAWSEYRQGAWTKKQLTQDEMIPFGLTTYQYYTGSPVNTPDIFFPNLNASSFPGTETINIAPTFAGYDIIIAGTATPGDMLTLTFTANGTSISASYTVVASDTTTTIATNLATQVTNTVTGNPAILPVVISAYPAGDAIGIICTSTGILSTSGITITQLVTGAVPTLPTYVIPGFMQTLFFSSSFDSSGNLNLYLYCLNAAYEMNGTQVSLIPTPLSYSGIGQFTFTGYNNSEQAQTLSKIETLPWPFESPNSTSLQPGNMALSGSGLFYIQGSAFSSTYGNTLDFVNPILPGTAAADPYSLLFDQENMSVFFSYTGTTYPTHVPWLPFVFYDSQRNYFVNALEMNSAYGQPPSAEWYVLYHPHIRDFLQTLNISGIPGLLQLRTQELADMLGGHFYTSADPSQTTFLPAYHDDGMVCFLFNVSPDGSGNSFTASDPGGTAFTYYLYSSTAPAPVGTVPLYLLSNSLSSGQNFYTISEMERQNAISWYGYTDHQIIGYVFDPRSGLAGTNSSFPLYRLSATDFVQLYQPNTTDIPGLYPHADIDFTLEGAYSIYNWELFFHIPFLIATQLSQNQQFSDAQTWFHYIFNPTNDAAGNAPNSYWNFLPFNQNSEIESLFDLLEDLGNPSSPGYSNMQSQVTQYETNPFDPDAIARLRPIAYQKAVVMAYIDNLIAWGDYLFGQNTRESINEATQVYVLAQQVLGPQPVMVTNANSTQTSTYMGLGKLDALSDTIVQAENLFPFSSGSGGGNGVSQGGSQNNSAVAYSFYFCIPPNDQLLGYWATVADRLYKIRHCMNIQGQVQQLALFAPPINPALLVEAEAAGVDLSSVLNDINAALPYYRFSYLLPKAVELCSEVRSLGGALLAALEKKDTEALAVLRANQELAVLNAVLLIKQTQVQEAAANVQALQASLAVTTYRQSYYTTLINNGLSAFETGQVVALTAAQVLKTIGQAAQLLAPIGSQVPQVTVGDAGMSGPVALATYGGDNLGSAAMGAAQAFNLFADIFSFLATMASLLGQWDRRNQEWGFQLKSATLELAQINQQINAANFRSTIAQQDLTNQSLLIGNASDVLDFLQTKYTNEDLYSWMVSQVSAVYFQCYQLAYSLAKQAEACFRFELGLPNSNYIQFGYWDSLKQGLLSGEKLYLDLKRLELAYMSQNKREYEITRNISLLLLDPIALITLKQTGQCIVNLPEAFFDMDYPGHYMRRIKTLTLTIPCVTGPYTSVNCTLTLVQNKIRWDSSVNPSYAEQPVAADPRFFYNFAASEAIATSTAQNDSGMFEVNFRDERYLPFEGAGVISQWLVSMPLDCNAFDFENITDVIVNLKYTARDAGGPLANAARSSARIPLPATQAALGSQQTPYPSKQTNLVRFFSLKHEFPTEWYQFLYPNPSGDQTMSFFLPNERFPFQYRGRKITISQVQLFLVFKAVYPASLSSGNTPLGDYGAGQPLPLVLNPPAPYPAASGSPGTPNATLVSTPAFFNGAPYAQILFQSVPASLPSTAAPKPWTLTVLESGIQGLSANLQVTPVGGGGPFLNPEVLNDLFFVCQYAIS
jgi:hypothetical protein